MNCNEKERMGYFIVSCCLRSFIYCKAPYLNLMASKLLGLQPSEFLSFMLWSHWLGILGVTVSTHLESVKLADFAVGDISYTQNC